MIDFHPILPALQPHVNTPLPYHLPLHPVTMTTSQPPRSALRCVPPHRQLLHIPLSSSSAENTLIVCLFNARSVGTSRRRSDTSTFIQDNNIDIMLLTETWLCPAGDEAQDRRPGSAWVLGPLLSPLCRGGPAQKAGASPSS